MGAGKDVRGQGETGLTYLKELSIRLWNNVSVRISTFVIIVISAIGSTYTVIERLSVAPIRLEKEKIISEKKELDIQFKELSKTHKELKDTATELSKLSKVPILIFPVDNRPIIGQYVNFRWSYDANLGFKNFILELKHVTESGVTVRRYPIPEGYKRRKVVFQFPEPVSGEFFWRIGTGELLHDYGATKGTKTENIELNVYVTSYKPTKEDKKEEQKRNELKAPGEGIQATRLWSRYGSFEMYPTVWEKLKKTQQLKVGTTAPYLSYDYPIDCGGRPDSYDMDLVDWIGKGMERILRAEVEVEKRVNFEIESIKYDKNYANSKRKEFNKQLKKYTKEFKLEVIPKIIEWDDKFSSVINGDVDVVVANLTKSATREKVYRGLKFTNGYRNNEQALVTSNLHLDLPKGKLTQKHLKKLLKGKNLAVQKDSTNYQAAEVLQKEFHFNIDSSPFDSYADVIDYIRSGKAEFGLIDQVRFDSVGYQDLIRIDSDMQPLLAELNQRVFGSKNEEYALAVASHGGRNHFLRYMNKIIEDGAEYRKNLEKIHTYNHRKKRSSKSTVCGK